MNAHFSPLFFGLIGFILSFVLLTIVEYSSCKSFKKVCWARVFTCSLIPPSMFLFGAM